MNELFLQLRELLPALWLKRWWGLATTLLLGTLGAAVVMLIPNKYEATARVFVDTQSILKPLMAGLAVQPNVDQQVQMMARTLISRPNVERVVRMSDLDLQTRNPLEREQMVDALIKKIDFKPSGGNNLYSVAYRDDNPEAARKVVQSLLSIFVESNLGDKRRDSDQARRFIDEQIALYQKKLLDAESALKDFKIRNLQVMPNMAEDYVTMASNAQKELDSSRLELRQLENSREALRRQLSEEKPSFTSSDSSGNPIAAVQTDTERRLEFVRKQLDDLTLRYTDEHPDVINQRRVLRDLEIARAAEIKASASGVAPRGGSTTVIPNKVYQDIKIAMAEIESKIGSARAKLADAENRLAQSKAASQTVPKIEAEFTQLNRDYDINKKNYEALVARRESAAMSGDMESKSGIGEFRVIDPPRVTPQPIAPNRPLLLTSVLLGSIAAGLGVAFLLNQLKPTFFDGRSLRAYTGMPLLGSVSLLVDPLSRARNRKAVLAFSSSTLLYLALFGALIAWHFLKLLAR
jgi:polysaccharide chain length determinant protein (PEP-CTERM system associated)